MVQRLPSRSGGNSTGLPMVLMIVDASRAGETSPAFMVRIPVLMTSESGIVTTVSGDHDYS